MLADAIHSWIEQRLWLKPSTSISPAACVVCGSVTRVADVKGFQSSIQDCSSCGHQSLVPMPTAKQITDYYTGYSTTVVDRKLLDALIATNKNGLFQLARKSGLTPETFKGKKFLDFGFGAGAAAFAACQLGADVSAFDYDADNVARAREFASSSGAHLDFREGSIETIATSPTPFDIIHAAQVVEHTPDPNAFLAATSRNQQRGGLVWLCVPNNRALFFLIKNSLRLKYDRENFYNCLKEVEHLQGFTRKSLALLVERHGYRVVECSDYSLRDVQFQPENQSWYPRLGDATSTLLGRGGLFRFQKSLIGSFDHTAHLLFRAGHYLYLIAARK